MAFLVAHKFKENAVNFHSVIQIFCLNSQNSLKKAYGIKKKKTRLVYTVLIIK